MSESLPKPGPMDNHPIKRYGLPKYPWIDTFFTLTILMAMPYWMCTICLILYVVFGNNEMLDNTLSSILSLKLNIRKQTKTFKESNLLKSLSIYSFLLFLTTDALCMVGVIFLVPSTIPYIMLFAKAFLASNLTSTRSRYMLDALSTGCALILIEYSCQFFIDYFEIIRSDSGIDLSLSFDSIDLIKLNSFKNSSSISKRLVYYLSFRNFHYDSSLLMNLEICLQFLHATLSLYTIMHNVNPMLRKTPGFKFLYALTDGFDMGGVKTDDNDDNKSLDEKKSDTEPSHSQQKHIINISNAIANSHLPKQTLKNFNFSDNLDDNDQSIFDLSSATFVVARNFENFCKSMWSSKESIEYNINYNITNISPRPNRSKNSNNLNIVSTPAKISTKIKNYNNDKIKKYHQQRYQQPIWTLLNAGRTMFFEQDYYSGAYYSHNALTTTSYGYDDYSKKLMMASSQCFIWYIGETTLGFELHSISLEQLLIKVNGIIWPHVSSCRVKNTELVFVNGLSPLFQYDVEFIKITINGELIHLSTNTVSTVFKDRSVTESTIQSPITTMQNSVATTQEAIEREKAKLKKLKTDWRKRSSQLKSEIENLNLRINQADESRNYKKLENLRSLVSQIDASVTELSHEHDQISLQLLEIDEAYLDSKRLFETECRLFKNSERSFHDAVDELKVQTKNLENERNQLLNKKEKILNKQLKFQKEIEGIKKWFVSVKQDLIKEQQYRRGIIAEQRKLELDELNNTLMKGR